MSIDPDRTPVIAAVGQSISRDHSLGPLELAEVAAADALGAGSDLAQAIDSVVVVSSLSSRAAPDAGSQLAARLGLNPQTIATTTVGGNTPQWLVTRAASEIRAGRSGAAIIVGGEALRTRRLRSAADRLDGQVTPAGGGVPDPVLGRNRQDLSSEERAAGLYVPLFVYPLFESVLATRAGRDPLAQREFLGGLLAPLTVIAAASGYAWFPEIRRPEDIASVSEDNRLVVEPYTKRMVAFLGAAQGASLVITSLAVARRCGLADEAIFVWSGASCDEVWYPIARPDLGCSAGAAAAGQAALQAGGVGIDDVELLDIYSCFPSALQIGAAALGIVPGDPRSLSVTGGVA
jgi:acetyl-CoA C-acetyltransferase